jgi:SAM-dependent methyltransferase
MSLTAISTSSSSMVQVPEHPLYLDPAKRPQALNESISIAFQRIVNDSSSGWGLFNGSSTYGICGVKEHALMKKIIDGAPSGQKDFYVLDIGAGNFQWINALAKYLNEQPDLPKDIKIHIIGVRGESYCGDKVVEMGQCKLYNLGAFKTEELLAQFKEQGLELENKIDLTVSSWCFRHFADPVGTFVQTYNLLRPETGLLLMDGFLFLHEKEPLNGYNCNSNMTQLFLDTTAPFLTQFYNDTRSLNHFMLRRPDAIPCRVPMDYLGTVSAADGYQIGSEIVTRFKREPQENDDQGFDVPLNWKDLHLYGDKALHDWLKTNRLLSDPSSTWQPIRDQDKDKKYPLLHNAVLAGDKMAIEKCLQNGSNINESDSSGYTALHISILKQNMELFKFLLDAGADFGLSNGENHTPLHEASLCDMKGLFLQRLIDAGANINARVFYGKTPLDCAIKSKNLKAIEILVKAGSEISEENNKALDDPAFSSLHQFGFIPPHVTTNALADISHWIERGDCVVFLQNGIEHSMYHRENASNKNPRLLLLNVNPQTPLLEEDEWPDVLRLAGHAHSSYDPEKVKNFRHIYQFDFGY